MNWHVFWFVALILVPAALTALLSLLPWLRDLPPWLLVGLGLGLFFAAIKAAVMRDDARRRREEAGAP